MTRMIRRLPTSVKLITFALVALILSSARGDSRSGTIAIVLLGGIMFWAIISGRSPSRRRSKPKRRREQSRPRSTPGLAGTIWRWAQGTHSRPPKSSPPQVIAGAGLNEILALTPGQFEEFTVGMLQGLGYTELRRTGGSGDLGVDISGRDPLGQKAVVQCKRYAPHRKIGTPVVQAFIGMMTVHHQADHGLIVATSRFTVEAISLAHHHGIVLIDGEALTTLLRQGDDQIRRRIERSWWRI